MSGLAVFALKCPSLLNFDEKQRETTIRHNLGTLYGIAEVPCDTQLRSILDAVNPVALEPAFLALHHAASHAGLFQHYAYLDGRVLIALDGTGHFSSHAIACPHCCIKHHRHAGPEYYHQLLGAVVVPPDYPVVIPLAPEPITKGDGAPRMMASAPPPSDCLPACATTMDTCDPLSSKTGWPRMVITSSF